MQMHIYSMDTDSFLEHIKIDDIYKDIAEDVETRFDSWIKDTLIH